MFKSICTSDTNRGVNEDTLCLSQFRLIVQTGPQTAALGNSQVDQAEFILNSF